LAPYIDGLTRASQLEKLNLMEVIKSMLSWQQQKSVEQHAPDRITVSSGSNIRISYKADHNPTLAVRVQEMFGATETPTICRGQVPLLLHLLSPAQRPIQITSDLKGFWERSYPEIKKELKGRYPKHYWPDDPVLAVATKGVKRKM
jgi:ATP-dependent helicase HrpB